MATFRPATREDAPVLAEVMYLAAQAQYANSGFDISLGGTRDSQISELAKLAAAPAPSWFHSSHFVVAEVDGAAVAAAAGFDRIKADLELAAALVQIGWSLPDMLALEARLQPVVELVPPEPANVWTVDHVAALPSARRRGLARGCVELVMARGRSLGFRTAKLDVFRGNAAAQNLYASLGFEVTETIDGPAFRTLLQRGPLERMTAAL